MKSKTRLVCIFGLAGLLLGCDTSRSIAILERDRLRAEKSALNDTLTYLSATPQPRVKAADVELFLGATTFDKILAALDKYSFTLKEAPGVVFQIASIRTKFSHGLPQLNIDISAKHLKWNVQVRLRVRANFDIQFLKDQNEAVLKIYVADVKPEIRVYKLNVPLGILVAQLLSIEAQKYINKLPEIRIPLLVPLDVDIGSDASRTRITLDQGFIDGTLRTPRLHKKYNINIIKWLTLTDGIHIYGRIGA